jgi:hypothetical protein
MYKRTHEGCFFLVEASPVAQDAVSIEPSRSLVAEVLLSCFATNLYQKFYQIEIPFS